MLHVVLKKLVQFSTLRQRSNKIHLIIHLPSSLFLQSKKKKKIHPRTIVSSPIIDRSRILDLSKQSSSESISRIELNRIESNSIPSNVGIKRQSVERERVAACGYDECGLEQRRIRGEKAAAGVTDLSPPITVQSVMFDAAVVFYAATSKRCVCIPRPTRLHPLH